MGPARMSLEKTREKYKLRGGSRNARAHAETRDDPENGRFGHFLGLEANFIKEKNSHPGILFQTLFHKGDWNKILQPKKILNKIPLSGRFYFIKP